LKIKLLLIYEKKIGYCKKCIVACILLVSIAKTSGYSQSSVQLNRFPHDAILKNSHIKMLIKEKWDLEIERKFCARKKNGEWKLVMEGFNPHYSGITDSAVQLWNTNSNPYRHLITGTPSAILSSEEVNKSDPFVIIKMNHRE